MKRFIRFFLPRRNKEDIALIKKVLEDYRFAARLSPVHDPVYDCHKNMEMGICQYVFDRYDVYIYRRLGKYGDEKGYCTFWAPVGHIADRIPLIEELLSDLIADKNLKIL